MTPTPSFPVEHQKELIKSHQVISENKKHIAELTRDIFGVETLSDPMRGQECGKKYIEILWRPNNYRLKIPFQRKLFRGQGIGSSISSGERVLKINEKITLMVHKSCVIGIFSMKNVQGEKVWFHVKCESVDDFSGWLDSKVKDIEMQLRFEIAKLGLPLVYDDAVWIRHEDGVKHEEFLDGLPENLVIHDTYFKKVYKDEVEFKSPVYVKNYITSRAVENIVPEIARELEGIKDSIRKASGLPSGRFSSLQSRIRSPVDVLAFEPEIRALGLQEREELSDWFFQTDCGRGR